jgi:hypothetical protein
MTSNQCEEWLSLNSELLVKERDIDDRNADLFKLG